MHYGCRLSVLSVEPYGMKLYGPNAKELEAVLLSVLSVEPYGMKPSSPPGLCLSRCLSVLSVEPYGMKHVKNCMIK